MSDDIERAVRMLREQRLQTQRIQKSQREDVDVNLLRSVDGGVGVTDSVNAKLNDADVQEDVGVTDTVTTSTTTTQADDYDVDSYDTATYS